jgi:hypothetical protein
MLQASTPPARIQTGFPVLPEPGSEIFFDILKLWIQDCNQNHPGCRPTSQAARSGADMILPTRLIDVGDISKPYLRLIEPAKEPVYGAKYIALSHRWGDTKEYPSFSTLRHDLSGKGRDIDTFKKAIPYEDLPKTFKDAVKCTRAMGIRYLWIDSICIIQGKDGDFNSEAKNMESVFSGADCVLASSRAKSQHHGFLDTRPQRKFLKLQRPGEKPFYVCEHIDNFNKDVLESALNTRGWVLQERALARRTIYFTEQQTYFECGNGIRCETLGRMHK